MNTQEAAAIIEKQRQRTKSDAPDELVALRAEQDWLWRMLSMLIAVPYCLLSLHHHAGKDSAFDRFCGHAALYVILAVAILSYWESSRYARARKLLGAPQLKNSSELNGRV